MLMSEEEGQAAIVEYYKSGDHRQERLGQYLMNRMPTPLTDSEVFYCEDDAKARDMFLARYTMASQADTAEWSASCDDLGIVKLDMQAVKARIKSISFHRVNTSTFCYLEIDNGWIHEGKSGVIADERFHPGVGRRIALMDALSNLYGKEAYLLKEDIFRGSKGPEYLTMPPMTEEQTKEFMAKWECLRKAEVKLVSTGGALSVTGLTEEVLK